MIYAVETTCEGDFHYRHLCLLEELAGVLEAHVIIITLRRYPKMFGEQPFQLTAGNADLFRDLEWGKRRLDVVIHQLYSRNEGLALAPQTTRC